MDEKKPIRHQHSHKRVEEKTAQTKKKKRLTEAQVEEKYPILAEIFEGL